MTLQAVHRSPELTTYLDDELPLWVVHVDSKAHSARVSGDTWELLNYYAPALVAYEAVAQCGRSGYRALPDTLEPYAEAVRRASEEVPFVVDRLSRLLQDSEALVAESASLAQGLDGDVERWLFSMGHARRRLAVLQEEIERSQAMLDLAGAALGA